MRKGDKKVKPAKVKKLNARSTHSGKSNVPTVDKLSTGKPRPAKSRERMIAEEEVDRTQAAHKLATRVLGTDELAALMQQAPGGAEPHQIKVRPRQFKNIIKNTPQAGGMNEPMGIITEPKYN